MALKSSRKIMLTAAAAALALGAGAPAMAGGGYYYGHGYHKHYGKHHYRGHYRRHHHHRHHGGGGKAAAIALGVIGGAIIINELAESRARDRYYRDRYYDARYRARPAPYYPERDYLPERDDDYDAGPEDGSLSGSDLDSRLDGGPEPIRISVDAAYDACTRHARAALANRGFVLAAPAAPETAEDAGGAWKMTATVLAEDSYGGSWSRAMYCEADESRVYLLELI